MAETVEPTPMGAVEDQIRLLKRKGVVFNRWTEVEAANALRYERSVHHVIACLCLFPRPAPAGSDGPAPPVEFGDLMGYLRLDDELRSVFGAIALDVERFVKVALLSRLSEDPREDGYGIVRDYQKGLTHWNRQALARELRAKSRHSDAYLEALGVDFEAPLSVQALLEALTFAQLVDFFRFCAKRWGDGRLQSEYQMLKRAKAIRNLTAHTHGLVHGFLPENASPFTLSYTIRSVLGQSGMRRSWRELVQNAPTLDLVTTLWLYQRYAPRGFQRERIRIRLQGLRDQIESLAGSLDPESYPIRCLRLVMGAAETFELL